MCILLKPRLAVVPLTNENTKKRYLKSMEDCQLNVEKPSFPARASRDWLKQHGLKGQMEIILFNFHRLSYETTKYPKIFFNVF